MLSEDIEIRKHFVSQKINNFTKISVQCIMCCLLLNRKAGRDKMGTLYSRLQKNPVLLRAKKVGHQRHCLDF
jgi:hypothetical protein